MKQKIQFFILYFGICIIILGITYFQILMSHAVGSWAVFSEIGDNFGWTRDSIVFINVLFYIPVLILGVWLYFRDKQKGIKRTQLFILILIITDLQNIVSHYRWLFGIDYTNNWIAHLYIREMYFLYVSLIGVVHFFALKDFGLNIDANSGERTLKKLYYYTLINIALLFTYFYILERSYFVFSGVILVQVLFLCFFCNHHKSRKPFFQWLRENHLQIIFVSLYMIFAFTIREVLWNIMVV